MASTILLQGGTVLQHGANDTVSAVLADVLVEGTTVTRIAPGIPAPAKAKVLDCRGKIVAPGAIDTHRHLWQTQAKGRHADQLLMEYLMTGNHLSSLYSPVDAELGQLGGGLESIDAGTTTVVDHSSIARSPEHVRRALAGLQAAGIRAVFCPAMAAYVKRWEPQVAFEDSFAPDWFLPTWDEIATRHNVPGSRVRVGLAFDVWPLGEARVKEIFAHVRAHPARAQLVTSHSSPMGNAVAHYHRHGLLGPDVLISHPNNMPPECTVQMLDAQVKFSSTPSTELQMGLGDPAALDDGVSHLGSLGVDCHSAASASIMEQARLLLQWARGVRNSPYLKQDNYWELDGVNYTVEQAFNLATIQGARAIGMEDQVGSVAEGKRADLVVWSGASPAMAVAAEHAPLAAVVLHSSPRDVDTVIVDGVVRKEGGLLLPVQIGGQTKSWGDVAKDLAAGYRKLQAEIDRLDLPARSQELSKAMSDRYNSYNSSK